MYSPAHGKKEKKRWCSCTKHEYEPILLILIIAAQGNNVHLIEKILSLRTNGQHSALSA
jgi:hypothetical protein